MSTQIIPELTVVKQSDGKLLITNQTDYGTLNRFQVKTEWLFKKANSSGTFDNAIGATYDPYLTNTIEYTPTEPGLYQITVWIDANCFKSVEILYYDSTLIETIKADFLECKAIDCGCSGTVKAELEKLHNYVAMQTIFDRVAELETAGEFLLASCILENVTKLLNFESNCQECP